MNDVLEIGDTIDTGEEVRHRLALGLECVDALSRNGAYGPLRVEIESIGRYAFPKVIGDDRQAARFDVHRTDRHAMRYADRVKKLVDRVVLEKAGNPAVDTDWIVRVYAPRNADATAYDPANEARNYVPRRLRLALALDGKLPAATPLNIRAPWLWPGSAYPLPDTTTIIRGRVLRGASIAAGVPVRWARVYVTVPDNGAFDPADVAGSGHSDDRGEFVVALGRKATAGAALINPVPGRLWAFFPAAAPPGNPKDALADLPIEDAGLARNDMGDNEVLRGDGRPATYTAKASQSISVRLGAIKSDAQTTLLHP